MSLLPHERDRVQYLLGKQQSRRLMPHEENELRGYLERMDAEAAKWGTGALVAFGLGLVAAWAMLRNRGGGNGS